MTVLHNKVLFLHFFYVVHIDNNTSITLDKSGIHTQCTPNAGEGINVAAQRFAFLLRVKNGVLLKFEGANVEDADVVVTTVKNALMYMINGMAEEFSLAAKIEGDNALLTEFMSQLNQLKQKDVGTFNIVEP